MSEDSVQMYIKTEDALPKLEHGLGFNIFQGMQKYKKNIAQFNMGDNKEDSYDCLLKKSISTALKLKAKNLGDDPLIAICADNHCDTYIPMFAAFFLGYRVVSMDGALSKANLSHLIGQVNPNIIFMDDSCITTMKEITSEMGIQIEFVSFGTHEDCSSFQEYLQDLEGVDGFEPVKVTDESRTACIMFSSGTTGLQKAMTLPNGGLLRQAQTVCYCQSVTEHSKFFFHTKISWITSIILTIACSLTGAMKVIGPKEKTWEAIHQHKATHMFLSPFLTSQFLQLQKPENCETDSLKCFSIAGYRLSPIIEEKVKKMFPKALVVQNYGQTEMSGWISMFYLNKEDKALAPKKQGSVGKPIPGICCKVIDIDTGKLLGPNQVGELRLKCEKLYFTGYINNDASTEFDSEGWFKTGDLVYYDNDKFLYITGRCKELLKYRSFHIEPKLLENILESHPAVDQAVVIGIDHEIDGDHPLGAVKLLRGHCVSEEELLHFVDERVQEQQRLRAGVVILDEMPSTANGKPLRRVIKELVLNYKMKQ